MATTKTTKQTTQDSPKSLAQLRADVAARRAELVEQRRSHKAGELVNPHALTTTRKQIARLETAITAAERAEQLASQKESN